MSINILENVMRTLEIFIRQVQGSVVQKKVLGIFQEDPGGRGQILGGGVSQSQLPVEPGLQAAADKVACPSPQEQARQQSNAKTVFHHGEDGELIDGDIPDVRLQMILLQYPVDIAAGSIGGGDKGNVFKKFQRDLVADCEGVFRRQHGKQFILHDGKKLVALFFLTADEADVHPAFLDPPPGVPGSSPPALLHPLRSP